MVEHLTFNQTVAGSNPAVLMNKITYNFHSKTNLALQINFNWFLFYQLFYTQLSSKFTSFKTLYPFLFRKNLNTILNKPVFDRSCNTIVSPAISNLSGELVSTKKLFNLEYRWTLFLVYFQFMDNKKTNFYSPHANFKNMFLFDSKKSTLFFNHSRFYMRWTHTYNLLLNIFFKQITPVVFSTKMFKKEVTAFNWQLDVLDYSLFKRATPYFFLKDSKYGDETTSIFHALESQGLNVSFVTDIKYHEKNVFFLKRFNSYTIGIVPFNMNPWLVSYCIPIATNNIIIEYFFFKLLAFIRQYAAIKRYSDYKLLWETL